MFASFSIGSTTASDNRSPIERYRAGEIPKDSSGYLMLAYAAGDLKPGSPGYEKCSRVARIMCSGVCS